MNLDHFVPAVGQSSRKGATGSPSARSTNWYGVSPNVDKATKRLSGENVTRSKPAAPTPVNTRRPGVSRSDVSKSWNVKSVSIVAAPSASVPGGQSTLRVTSHFPSGLNVTPSARIGTAEADAPLTTSVLWPQRSKALERRRREQIEIRDLRWQRLDGERRPADGIVVREPLGGRPRGHLR
jgi:hypothetical protein